MENGFDTDARCRSGYVEGFSRARVFARPGRNRLYLERKADRIENIQGRGG